MFIRDMLKNQQRYSPSECAVADYLLGQGKAIEQQTTREIAEALFISAPSVVRFCQKLGFSGFNDFRRAYLEELDYFSTHFNGIDVNRPFDAQDDIMVVAAKLSALHKETCEDTLSIISRDALKYAVQMLLSSTEVVVCANGHQYEIARIFKSRMATIGRNVNVSHSMTDNFMRACMAGKGTSFLLVSYSGESDLLLRVAQKVAERRLPAVAITSLGSNSLSKLIPHILPVTTREHLRGTIAPFASAESMMLLFDLLYACVFNANHEVNLTARAASAQEFERLRRTQNPVLADDVTAFQK